MAKPDIEAILPLSPLQEGLLFHALAERAADPYFMQSAYLLEGELDVAAFERAWNMLAVRHAILRTGFVWQGVEKPVQVARACATLPLVQRDLRHAEEHTREAQVHAFMAADRRAGFDLLKPPLMRLALLRLSERAFCFINSHHHLLLDGWSFALLLREALACYRALVANEPPALAPARPYREYLAWVARQDEGAAERFFRAALAGFHTATPLPMTSAGQRGAAQPSALDALPCAEQELGFSRVESAALAAAARAHHVTLNTLIQGAFSLLLQRHGGQREVLFGATVSGRPPDLPGAEAIVGVLINTLPVRVELPPGARAGAWLMRLQEQNSELRQYEWTPLSRVRRASELPGDEPLFESIIVFDSYPEQEAGDAPLDVRPLARSAQHEDGALLTPPRNNYPLSLIVEPASELRLVLCYARDRLSHAAAASLLAQLRTLIRALAHAPDARLAELPLVEPSERERLLYTWNRGPRAAHANVCVHALFAAQAEHHPHALALVQGQTALSYGELDRRADRLAARIARCLQGAGSVANEAPEQAPAGAVRRQLAVAPDSRIAIYLPRSADLVIAILGALKAGAAYVPLDPKFPRARVREILADSGVRIVLTHACLASVFDGAGCTVLALDAVSDESDDAQLLTQARARVRPENLAYLIYTSGSTGRPKGVAVEHRQLVHYVHGVLARLPLEGVRSMAFVSTVAADLGHTSLFGALCSGRTLHILDDACAFDPDALAEAMHRAQIDAMKIVPSHLAALLEAATPARVLPRRCLILGGEAASPALLERVRTLAPACAIVNHYGPTETTVGALTHRISAASSSAPPIGRPLPGVQAYVLGAQLQPVPVGMAGELYIGGAGVARGYHARPALTAERFVPDPFGRAPGGRLYRTGDRARFRGDGAIEFLGRGDHQLKVRGNRVELGEIEACLRAHSQVREAVVCVHVERAATRLVAYTVAQAGTSLDPETLQAWLRQQLPDYMVPGALSVLPALPLTRNGKIDRAALAQGAPPVAPQSEPQVGPRNEIEASLAQIWAQVLGRERVGIHDDFFALGGDSILSLQIIARSNQKGIRVTPKQLFAGRTIAAIAAPLSAGTRVAPAATAAPSPRPERFALARLSAEQRRALERVHGDQLEDLLPASPIQQGMLFHALLSPEANPYFNQIVCRFSKGLDPDAFARAFAILSARHEILRTGFVLDQAAEPHQLVRREVRLPLELHDWRARSEPERTHALAELLARDRGRSFCFDEPPLMRVTAIRLADHCWDLLWSVHHALLDGWCQGRMVQEWLALYDQLQRGSVEPRGPAPAYRDYVAWLARQDLGEARSFFRGYLRGFRAPLRLPAPAGLAPATSAVRELRRALSGAETIAVQTFAQAQGVTLNTVVQAAWALLLARYSGQDDVLFGVTVAGRAADLAGAEEMMGSFINSLPLRVQVEPQTRLAPWLERLQSLNLELRQYEFSPLVEVQRCSELAPDAALFDTLLVFQNVPVDDAALDQQRERLGIELTVQEAWTHYPLTLYAVPGSQLSFQFAYDAQRLDEALIARMADEFTALIPDLVGRSDAMLVELAGASEADASELCARGDIRPDFPAETVLAMFRAQAERTPAAVAVRAGEQELSYGELHARIDALARELCALGVGRESLVGLCTTRSLDMMVGLFGILKAGAAYVPLDPAYPRERLRTMLEDAPLTLLLTQTALAQQLPPSRARVLYLDRLPSSHDRDLASRSTSTDSSPAAVNPEALAYVIYTSGSTGRPKGVMVRHGAVANFLRSMIEQLAFDDQLVLLATTSLSFDIAVLELFAPLVVGGQVVLASRDDVADGERLAALLASSRASCLQATPTGWKALLEAGRPRLEQVTVLCGGEALSPELLRSLRAAGGAPWNLYGPTETTVWSTCQRVRPEQASAPLGRPLANTDVYLLDRQLRLAPVGVVGEVYIGGAGLARGYLGQPALTAECFVPDPYSAAPGSRMYKTGDLAQRARDGSLHYLGRSDHQLKLRGHRIELGEIESQLRAHSAVADAVVSAYTGAGAPFLIGYVVPAADLAPSVDELRRFLQQRLPDYMVPARYVALDRLPTTPNGKVDRRALPAPPEVVPVTRAHPGSATEEILARIWAELLGRERVGVHESFFALGGHSLLATQAMSRVRAAFQLELPLRALFEQPTVAELARVLDETRQRKDGAPVAPPITRQARDRRLPLSFAQQRLWFFEQLERERGLYTLTFALRLTGPLDAERLRQSCEAVIARHEVLRTAISDEAGEPWQQIAPPARFELPLRDLSAYGDQSADAELEPELGAFFAEPIDLRRPPLLAARLLRLRAEQHVLALALHHIAADAWSLAILIEDLVAAYRALERGEAARLPPPALHYADYAVWQRQQLAGALWQEQLGYWRSQLAHPPSSLLLPGARPHASAEPRAARLVAALPPALLSALARRADQHAATLFMVLYAALNVVLHQQTGRDDLWVGTDVANRHHADTEAMVGFFVNQLVLRCRLQPELPFGALLERCKQVALEAYQHQDLPFDAVVAELAPARSATRAPLFQIKLVLQNTPQADLVLDRLTIEELAPPLRDVELDLLINASADARGLHLSFDYRSDLYPAQGIEQLSALYTYALELVAEHEDHTLSALSALLSERQQALAQRARELGRAAREERRAALVSATRRPVAMKGT